MPYNAETVKKSVKVPVIQNPPKNIDIKEQNIYYQGGFIRFGVYDTLGTTLEIPPLYHDGGISNSIGSLTIDSGSITDSMTKEIDGGIA